MYHGVPNSRDEFLQRHYHLLYLPGRTRQPAVVKEELGIEMYGVCVSWPRTPGLTGRSGFRFPNGGECLKLRYGERFPTSHGKKGYKTDNIH